ncbi:MAG: hypothetical protein ACLFUB_11840 [Cyclobacteriaceae bacterium]
MNEEEIQQRIFGHVNAHLPPGSWKDTIIQTVKNMDQQHFMTDKITGMIKENRLYSFYGVRGHPDCVLRKRSLHI